MPDHLHGLMPGFTPHTTALGAVLSTPGVGTALVGMRNVSRVEEAIALGAADALSAGDVCNSLMHA